MLDAEARLCLARPSVATCMAVAGMGGVGIPEQGIPEHRPATPSGKWHDGPASKQRLFGD